MAEGWMRRSARAEFCVLTRIAFDHREYLGDTLDAIAGEKAAVLRAGTRGFSAPQVEAAARTIRAAASAVGASVAFVPQPLDVRISAESTEFGWRRRTVQLRMVGRHQAQNAVLALEVLRELVPDAPPESLTEAIGAVQVPGRFQAVQRAAGPLLLDVAHNPDALSCFAQALEDAYAGRERRVFLAMLRDKDLGSPSRL